MSKKIFLILIIFLLTGCYDHQELNNIAILTATEINKVDDEFVLNAQIVNPQSPDKTTNVQAPFIIYTGKGKTIQGAYREIKLQSSRYIYPDHLRILIVNEKIAKEDITEILDFYLRNPLARTEFNILIGRDEDILSVTTPIDRLSSTSILESLKNSNTYLGVSNLVTLNELADTILNPNKEIILPSISLENENSETDNVENTENTKLNSMYKLNGLAIFKDNQLKGYLTNEQSITYNIIKNNVENTILTYECEKDKYLTIEMISNKSKIITKNKEINIDIDLEGTINESTCNIELNNNQNIIDLEKILESYLKNRITKDIQDIINKYNSDVFGFLDIIYKHDYKTYEEVKDSWYDDTFKNIKINIDTNLDIIAKGNVLEGNNEKN